jgi:predicted dehydrogenase
MSEFTVGFIGTDQMARLHADRVRALDQRITAVADVDPSARHRFADEYDVETTFKSYEEMLASQSLDVVMVDVPNTLHVDAALEALEQGTNVLVEKPLAHDYDAARRIERAENASEATLMVSFTKTFDSDIQTLHSYLGDERLGDIYEVNVEFVRRRGIPKLGSWFTEEDAAGGGVVIDIGPHVLHLTMSLLDFPEIETISATTGAQFGVKAEEYTYLDMWGGDPVEDGTFDVEDTMRAFVRTADDTTLHLNCAWASNTDPRQFVEVLGDEGGATLTPDDGLTIHTTAYGALADHHIETNDTDPYAATWDYFFDVLRGDRDHDHNTVHEGVVVQELIDAIYRSSEDHREVELADGVSADPDERGPPPGDHESPEADS